MLSWGKREVCLLRLSVAPAASLAQARGGEDAPAAKAAPSLPPSGSIEELKLTLRFTMEKAKKSIKDRSKWYQAVANLTLTYSFG